MESILPFSVPELTSLKHYPDTLYFRGDAELLKRPKISIIGTRHPNQYTRSVTYELAKNVIFNKKRECTLISDNQEISHV